MEGSKDEKKAKIIQLSIETIRKHGIKKTTIEDIANASGMAPASIYYYFSNKKELLRAAVSTIMNTVFDGIEIAVKSPCSPEEKLISTWKAIFLEANKSGFFLNLDMRVRSQLMMIAGEIVDEFDRRHKALVRKILLEGKKQGVFHVDDIEMTSTFLSNGVWGLILNTVDHGKMELTEAWVDELGKLLMNGLKKR